MSAARQTMVLPPHERSSGEVASRWPHGADVRIPSPLRSDPSDTWSEDHPARVAEHSPHTKDACADGRHLFDIIESTIERETEQEQRDGTWTYGYDYEFRARLTCVRCGRVDEWQGTRTERRLGYVAPAPIIAGDLVAQQTGGEVSEFGRDYTTWTIYREGVRVGAIGSGRGSRGRAFHAARFDAWADGHHVEGKDAAAALRRLGRGESGDRPVGSQRAVGAGPFEDESSASTQVWTGSPAT